MLQTDQTMPVKRRLPRWSEIARFVGPSLDIRRREKWARVRTVGDFADLARRRTPRAVFDYVAGAAESELSCRRSVQAFKEVSFRPHVLRDVATIDSATIVLGRPISFPVILGPTGFTRMMHTGGELAVARAAARHGIPYTLSTLGTTSVERLQTAGERWFQVYLWKDRGRTRELLARARESGFTNLVLTVDVPVAGTRLRDVYNGLTMPPTLSAGTLLNMARHPRWLADALTTEPLSFETLGPPQDVMSLINTAFEPAMTVSDVSWLTENWTGHVIVKGVLRTDDAKAAVAAGAAAIAVSNHGGRQLDRAVAPLDVLRDVVDAIGDSAEVYLDGGVRSGADVAAAIALGAKATFVARPYLYALMAGGEEGVDHLLALFKSDYVRTLQLLGVTRTGLLSRDVLV